MLLIYKQLIFYRFRTSAYTKCLYCL